MHLQVIRILFTFRVKLQPIIIIKYTYIYVYMMYIEHICTRYAWHVIAFLCILCTPWVRKKKFTLWDEEKIFLLCEDGKKIDCIRTICTMIIAWLCALCILWGWRETCSGILLIDQRVVFGDVCWLHWLWSSMLLWRSILIACWRWISILISVLTFEKRTYLRVSVGEACLLARLTREKYTYLCADFGEAYFLVCWPSKSILISALTSEKHTY